MPKFRILYAKFQANSKFFKVQAFPELCILKKCQPIFRC